MKNLEKLIKLKGFDKQNLAELLFPNHKHPDRALNRILKGDSLLNSDQILRLSSLSDVSVESLLKPKKGEWEQTMHTGTYELKNGDWLAILYFDEWTTKIYHKGSLFQTHMLTNPMITVSDYMQTIEKLIAKSEFNQ